MQMRPLILISLMFWGCAHKPPSTGDTASKAPVVNLYVYRIEIGFKSAPTPIAELWMPREEFRKFVSTKEFRDREFRQSTFHNGCYLFRHLESRAPRRPASEAEPIYCYDAAYDVFLPKAALIP